ncbi:uncharacterized protein Cpr49Ah [Drosophila kikkawai]|uniref:Uncharacterized protein Cpr49Ah n=1 Tax=Drosophila kikkawai TaxID=30033 RepID=A0ABM4GCR1_DROKI
MARHLSPQKYVIFVSSSADRHRITAVESPLEHYLRVKLKIRRIDKAFHNLNIYGQQRGSLSISIFIGIAIAIAIAFAIFTCMCGALPWKLIVVDAVWILLGLFVLSCQGQHHHPHQQHQQHQNVNNIPRDDKPDHHRHEEHRETSTWIPIIKYNKEQSEDGSYKTEYETGNSIIHEETGFLKDFETNPNGVLVQHGQYSYQSPEGTLVNVQYTADENGFRATGDHIPTPPAIPEEIQKGLDQIYAGIKLQQERLEQRAKTDPDFARKLEERRVANQNGQYIGLLENQ